MIYVAFPQLCTCHDVYVMCRGRGLTSLPVLNTQGQFHNATLDISVCRNNAAITHFIDLFRLCFHSHPQAYVNTAPPAFDVTHPHEGCNVHS